MLCFTTTVTQTFIRFGQTNFGHPLAILHRPEVERDLNLPKTIEVILTGDQDNSIEMPRLK